MAWDKMDADLTPTFNVVSTFTETELWDDLCTYLDEEYAAKSKFEYSRCSDPGWNLKYKKAGRSLCTLYPKEGYFTALIVIGERERSETESALPDLSQYIQNLYHNTKEGMGQRWLMIDVTDSEILEDVKELIAIRRRP